MSAQRFDMGKQFSAEEIFRLIDNQSVNVKEGVRLIETYALTKANEAIEALRNDAGLHYSAEVEVAG